jgi:hypothetical protein
MAGDGDEPSNWNNPYTEEYYKQAAQERQRKQEEEERIEKIKNSNEYKKYKTYLDDIISSKKYTIRFNNVKSDFNTLNTTSNEYKKLFYMNTYYYENKINTNKKINSNTYNKDTFYFLYNTFYIYDLLFKEYGLIDQKNSLIDITENNANNIAKKMHDIWGLTILILKKETDLTYSREKIDRFKEYEDLNEQQKIEELKYYYKIKYALDKHYGNTNDILLPDDASILKLLNSELLFKASKNGNSLTIKKASCSSNITNGKYIYKVTKNATGKLAVTKKNCENSITGGKFKNLPYEKRTVEQLKSLAKSRNIKCPSSLNKSDLINLLRKSK